MLGCSAVFTFIGHKQTDRQARFSGSYCIKFQEQTQYFFLTASLPADLYLFVNLTISETPCILFSIFPFRFKKIFRLESQINTFQAIEDEIFGVCQKRCQGRQGQCNIHMITSISFLRNPQYCGRRCLAALNKFHKIQQNEIRIRGIVLIKHLHV